MPCIIFEIAVQAVQSHNLYLGNEAENEIVDSTSSGRGTSAVINIYMHDLIKNSLYINVF